MTEELVRRVRNFTEIASEIVAAYVSNNPVPVSELPNLLRGVHDAVAGLDAGSVPDVAASSDDIEKPSPAQIRKSVRDDGITSFIDGKTYKTLKRHLTKHGLSPQSYRAAYGLPADYPMVAQSYSDQRSALAKSIGLGVPGAYADQRRTGTDG